ncbi:MAG: hypothetical protein ACP5HS_02160 [Anaerolineae bacterium]
MTDKLYFNGLHGLTGRYGLEPMTVEALAHRILADRGDVVEQLRGLQRELAHRALNERKILDIVELLSTDLGHAVRGDEALPDDWATVTAHKLLTILFGSQPDLGPGPAQMLAERLELHPREVFVRIVRLLSKGQGAALASWLLDHQAENPTALRENLESRFDQALLTLQDAYLAEDAPQPLPRHGVLRQTWIDGFCSALLALPVASLQVVPNVDAITGPLRRLVDELGSFRALRRNNRRRPSRPVRELTALSALGAEASWYEVVTQLRDFLEAATDAELNLDNADLRRALRAWLDELRRNVTGRLGTVPWVDPRKLSESGWGIIFPAQISDDRYQAIHYALSPLLKLRQEQAGELFYVFAGKEGYRPGDTADAFLRRAPRRASVVDPVDPQRTGVPYYLLLVGSPEEIPFDFQYQLDVQYAVGRLDFGDDLSAYENYAWNVVVAEMAESPPVAPLVFFGTDHSEDEATSLSSKYLVKPLASHFEAKAAETSCQVIRVVPEKATKTNLLKLLQLETPPSLLFTATHGLEFDSGDPRQVVRQGALVCQEWQGKPGEIPADCYLAAEDISEAMNLQGMILFLFGCFSAGTPRYDEYHRSEFRRRAEAIAECAFVAELPRAMLALRDRGALAVIGHVERAWGLSFLSEMSGRPEGMASRRQEHIEAFAAVIDRLLEGHPVGSALEFLNMRYAAAATELTYLYERMADPPSLEDVYRLAELWTSNNDARGYVLLGDPATRLRSLGMDED